MLQEGRRAYRRSRFDFARFALTTEPDLIPLMEGSERGRTLSQTYGAFAEIVYEGSLRPGKYTKLPSLLQIRTGSRPTGRRDDDGKPVSEGGLALVYSIGPTGQVAVLLYPFSSKVMAPFEQSILLAHVKCDRAQLLKRIPSDVRTLVAYAYETSLDARPTWRESARVWWVRWTCATHAKGEYAPSKTSNIFAKLLIASGSGAVSGFAKVVTPFLIALLAAWLGLKLAGDSRCVQSPPASRAGAEGVLPPGAGR